jgi:sulfur carrier protein ThiS
MDVTVKLHGVLRRHRPKGVEGAPHHPFTMNLPATATVNDIPESLGFNQGIGFVVSVNGEAAELSAELSQGDVVYFFPPAAGG